MTKLVCDRCGKEIKDNEQSFEITVYTMRNRDALAEKDVEMDICEDCRREVENFIFKQSN